MSYEVLKYRGEFEGRWDEFVDSSRNGTFLLRRDYMDYHSDRFADCSWIAFKNGRLAALLPANLTDDGVLHSHGGLTYGGWVLPRAHIDGNDLLEIFCEAVRVWHKAGIRRLDYKPIPSFYALQPSEEDQYALFRLGATLTERNISSTIQLSNGVHFNTLQRRHLAKASTLPISIEETTDIAQFMAMLADCLRERHDTQPVHSIEEMQLLASRFPENIRFFAVMLDGRMQAGVCIYDTSLVAHAQYIATTAKGRELNLLTPLFNWLITERYSTRRYFDFGISNEEHGRILNAGLLRQKCSYGATGTCYSRYSLDLTSALSTLNDR